MIKIIWDEILSVDTSRKSLRSFGLVVGGVLLAIAAVVFWRSGWAAGTAVYVLGSIGGILVLLGAVLPTVLKPAYMVWMGLAVVLGYIMTRVILTIVFYLVVTPIGILMRVFGRDPLDRKLEPNAPTYWRDKEYDDDRRARLEKYY